MQEPLGDSRGPPRPRASGRKSRPQENDSRTRHLRTNPQVAESELSINSKHQRPRQERPQQENGGGSNAGHKKTGRSTELLSLEELLGCPTGSCGRH